MNNTPLTARVGILTLGCRVNQYESEAIAEGFTALGFSLCAFEDDCDIYLIHTCAVTAESERKSKQMIRRALRRREEAACKGKRVLVAVCGCYPQRIAKGKEENLPFEGVAYLTGNTNKSRMAEEVAKLWWSGNDQSVVAVESMTGARYDEMKVAVSPKTRAFVKIEDGCNSFCTYCIVPYLRGRVRSRGKAEILSEVEALVASGAGEIYLTGIETAAYGAEEKAGMEPFLSLVRSVAAIPGCHRLGFGSLKPDVFTDEFIQLVTSTKVILPHFHLSIQHGADAVLERMGRSYTASQVLDVLARVRKENSRVTFSADLIVGFPGETDEDFFDMEKFIKSAGLLHAHIFPYSPREGTAAAKFDHQVAPEIKRRRMEELQKTANAVAREIAASFDGQTFDLLIETLDQNYARGHTENNLEMKIPRQPNDRVGGIRTVVYHV